MEAFIYIGPTGLRYGQGKVTGRLDTAPGSLEVELGHTAPLHWEHLYLGELVPTADTDIVSFNNDLHSEGCELLSRDLLRALTQLANTDGRAISLAELEAMGFPHLDAFRSATDLHELAAEQKLIYSLGISKETTLSCVSAM